MTLEEFTTIIEKSMRTAKNFIYTFELYFEEERSYY